eukprot:1161866-Pelagomonas_calceolata.AAC.1
MMKVEVSVAIAQEAEGGKEHAHRDIFKVVCNLCVSMLAAAGLACWHASVFWECIAQYTESCALSPHQESLPPSPAMYELRLGTMQALKKSAYLHPYERPRTLSQLLKRPLSQHRQQAICTLGAILHIMLFETMLSPGVQDDCAHQKINYFGACRNVRNRAHYSFLRILGKCMKTSSLRGVNSWEWEVSRVQLRSESSKKQKGRSACRSLHALRAVLTSLF